MPICTLPQTDNHTSTPQLSFLQTRWPSCHQTNSIKALKALPHSLSFWIRRTQSTEAGMLTNAQKAKEMVTEISSSTRNVEWYTNWQSWHSQVAWDTHCQWFELDHPHRNCISKSCHVCIFWSSLNVLGQDIMICWTSTILWYVPSLNTHAWFGTLPWPKPRHWSICRRQQWTLCLLVVSMLQS